MQEDKFIMFYNRLVKVFKHLNKQAKRLGISCYRVYNHDLPEFPFCIEIYGENLYVAEYKRHHGMDEDEHERWMEKCLEIITEVLKIPAENIFLKLRQRKPGRLGQYQKLDQKRNELLVEENGLKFIVNLSDYLDTGLFLDHRITREKVKTEAKDNKVLNLFAYTGSFSVYAAAGGASKVMTVDLSKTYLHWAERNMQLNGFTDENKFSFFHADVLQFLPGLADQSFDLIIMDPPTFSNSKRMNDFLDIQRDHVKLINECLRILIAGGKLYFSTNFREFNLDKEKIQSSSIKDITKQTTPFDFEKKLFRWCFLIKKD
jgi:23S rRNA (cytosine1962-C5)-methyltransferase